MLPEPLVTGTAEFPMISEYATLYVTAPSVSPYSNVNDADQLFPDVLDTVTRFAAIASPPDAKDTVGELIGSFAVNERVAISSTFASVLEELLDTSVTLSNSADELSYVQLN